MTVTAITHVFGIKVPKAVIFQWCLQNPESEWAKTISSRGVVLSDYINYLNTPNREETSPYCDYDMEIFGSLNCGAGESTDRELFDQHGHLVFKYGIYVPTHDQLEAEAEAEADEAADAATGDEDYVVVGVRVGYISTTVDDTVKVDDRLIKPSGESIQKAKAILHAEPFFKWLTTPLSSYDKEKCCQLCLIQNDCHCCT